MNERQVSMVGHGSVIMLFGLLSGIGLTIKLIGGIEIFPTILLEFELPSTDRAWARAHAGGLMNGFMVLLVAVLMWAMKLPEALERKMFWMIAGAGYANTLFYWGGMLAPSRALTFGDNRLGENNIWGILGVAPAFVFTFISIYAFFLLMRHAFQKAKA